MWDTMFTVVLAIAALLIAMTMAYACYRLVREQR
jgi:CHASE1-domain containing sensor protein